MSMNPVFLALGTGLGAAIITFFLSRLLMRSGVVDAPDGERKQQAAPVPRLGGVAIFASLALFSPLYIVHLAPAAAPLSGLQPLILLAAVTVGGFAIGLWDDLATPPTKAKLILLTMLCFGVSALGLHPAVLTSPFGDMAIPAMLVIGSALWLLVFINAVNFMDGSNGMAVGSLLVMAIGLALAAQAHGALPLSVGWFAFAGAAIGFLALNLRGQLYAGDAGALGLGALFAGVSLISGLEVWTIATLALPFLVDVLMTLIWRARHRQSWLKPHLDHAYQRLIKAGWSHFDVALFYWGLSAVGGVAANIAARAGGVVPFMVFASLLVAGIGLWIAHRGSIVRK